MPQSSLMTWLKKPAAVRKAPDPVVFSGNMETVNVSRPTINAVQIETGTELANVNEQSTTSPQDTTASATYALQPLVANIELVSLSKDLLPAYQKLNALLLPIGYPASFYTETMTEPHHGVTLVAVWRSAPLNGEAQDTNEKPRLIGAIRCRILPSANLYISTIGVLSPYRAYGIATHLLNRIIAKASKLHGVRCVTAHVWEANEEALEWYKKRGFEIIGKEDVYYRKLRPPGAVLVRKWIGVGDLLGNSTLSNGSAT